MQIWLIFTLASAPLSPVPGFEMFSRIQRALGRIGMQSGDAAHCFQCAALQRVAGIPGGIQLRLSNVTDFIGAAAGL